LQSKKPTLLWQGWFLLAIPLPIREDDGTKMVLTGVRVGL
jgi:hypothetical protein